MPGLARAFSLLLIASAGAAAPPEPVAPPQPLADVTSAGMPAVAPLPVAIGIPVARGRLREDPAWPEACLRIDGRGATPADARVLERWPDGSIRWLLLDYDDAAARHRRRVARPLDLAPQATCRRSSLATESVDGGVRSGHPDLVTVTVPAGGPLLASLRAAGGDDVLALPWPRLVVDGATLAAPAVDRVEVETHGSVRGEVVVRARHDNGLAHEVRFATFAAQPWVRIRYTLTHAGDQAYLRLSALPLEFPADTTRVDVVVDGKERGVLLPGDTRTHRLAQSDAHAVLLDGAPVGRRADGVLRLTTRRSAWSLAIPRFWEEYPKRSTISKRGVVVDLAAASDEPLFFGVGAAKTWELWVAVHRRDHVPPLVPLGQALRQPAPVAIAPPDLVASGALPYAITPAAAPARTFLSTLRREIDRYRGRAMAERWDDGPPGSCQTRQAPQVHVGFYGALNWGDWNFPGFRDDTKGCDAWGNLEYDLPLVFGLTALALGDPQVWSLFHDAARHYRDVDIIHHWPGHESRVGLNHPHKVRHFATDAGSTVDLGHVWLDGLLLHYRLTGEARSREAVVRMADALGRLLDRARNPRQFGWPMVALAAAFEAIGDPRYRTAALAFASTAAERFPPDPNAEWKMGVLAEGMMAVHRATGDPGVRTWLDAYGQRLLVPAPTPRDPRLVIPAGYLFALTGDERYAALARTTAATLTPGSWGKPLASVGRVGFALLAPLARSRTGLTPAPVALPPPLPPESPPPSPPPPTPARPSDR